MNESETTRDAAESSPSPLNATDKARQGLAGDRDARPAPVTAEPNYVADALEALSASLPKLDAVIRQSAVTAAHLRSVFAGGAAAEGEAEGSGAQTAIERVERGLGAIVTGIANNTQGYAEIAKVQVEIARSGVRNIEELKVTTKAGIVAGEARDRVLVRLTWALVVVSVLLVVFTIVITYLTWVLVQRGPAA